MASPHIPLPCIFPYASEESRDIATNDEAAGHQLGLDMPVNGQYGLSRWCIPAGAGIWEPSRGDRINGSILVSFSGFTHSVRVQSGVVAPLLSCGRGVEPAGMLNKGGCARSELVVIARAGQWAHPSTQGKKGAKDSSVP
ncbi:hypothetical protein GX48_03944 [Paracoccidioides brasiliensis]|nr:hypothetical protein GX48_03944 [Paracoccidioides brasiliensis]